MSCAHRQSSQGHRLEGTIWIYGFWTGLNYVASASEQAVTKVDTAAVVVEVEKRCAQRPSQVWPAPCGPLILTSISGRCALSPKGEKRPAKRSVQPSSVGNIGRRMAYFGGISDLLHLLPAWLRESGYAGMVAAHDNGLCDVL